jgi:hypothetical protein
MHYICFGYLDEERWNKLSTSEQQAEMDACFDYDENVLKKKGYWVHGEGLQAATTLRYQNGKVAVTDGPYAETKELLGGLLIIEARDLNHAIQIISDHPGVKVGRWEIRPAQDLQPIIAESRKRRAAIKQPSS